MKIAFCLFKYFPFGGLQRDFIRIAKECVRRGHSVKVYTMKWEGELDPVLPVCILPSKGWQNHTRSKNFVKDLQNELLDHHYDLVFGFNKIPGLDVYYAADTCFLAKAEKKHGRWYQLLPRYRQLAAYEHAVFAKNKKTQILLISKAEQSKFTEHYQTELSRMHLLPPGIARDRIASPDSAHTRMETRREFKLNDEELLLLMIGSGFKTKGLDRIIQGMADLPQNIQNRTTLFVVGEGHAAEFKKQAQHLNIAKRVHFLGGRDDIPRLLLAADLLVHPAYNENTGTVLLEAIVSGLPVLTTDVCGYADYVNSANAGMVLSSPFKQDEFNQALQIMLLSENRTSWRQNGLAFAKEADIYNMTQHAVDIIESINARHLS